jgi:signal peptidase
MKRAKVSKLLRKDYVQTIILVIIMVVGVIAFWYGLKFALGTEYPLLAVASGSMEPVLYRGDLILVQGVHNASRDIHAAPMNAPHPGDVIIFYRPDDPNHELIVHRAIQEKIGPNGSVSFMTEGDHNGVVDPWGWVNANDIVGKWTGVKVPLLGDIALFFEPLQVKVAFIMLWIVILVIIELFPVSKKRVEEEQT